MKHFGAILMASVAGLALVGAAQAADLPTKKAPPAPPAANCYASFWDWMNASAADCPLSAYGVTLYGQIDMGFGYETASSRFNPVYPNGVQELISKFSNKSQWQLVPNGLSQSNVGIKFKEQIAPTWFLIGDLNAGFDPYSLQFANGPESLSQNNFKTVGNQTANGDSSRTWGWDNSRAYVGVNNTTLGTLTFGRQYSFTNDASAAYDPFGGAYAFSLIGTSGTVLAGTGDTETARYNTSVKYLINYNGFRAGALAQVGGWQEGNGARAAYQFDLGGDYAGFSVDAIYAYAQDAVALGAYGSTAGPPAPLASDTLKATLADINAGVIAGKYKWNALTLYAGYEYAQLSTPTDIAQFYGTGANVYTLNGGYPGIIQKNAYVDPKDLQVLWLGAKYALRSDLDIAGAWYHEWQNNYAVLSPGAGALAYQGYAAAACAANTTASPLGGTLKGTNNSSCAGTTDVVSGVLDWRPVKRLDVYGGVMYSQVTGGMASGYLKNYNVAPTAGLRLSF